MTDRADAVAKAIHWAEVAEAREAPARYEREWSAAARDMARMWATIAGLLPEAEPEPAQSGLDRVQAAVRQARGGEAPARAQGFA
ncbi:hypothetical protein [Streptacidiphilus sp. EB129]|uniref:hypothetical protein n=1 Tax=Streptacidiphilus sp. EB129 TaxID=3156262 RepID=UPI003516F90D